MRHTVEEQIGRDPAAIALDKRIPHAALVATQVKYLARARTKLPSYYEARCILPPLAFEQASSEACAARKSCSGNTVLDLTCGLGVDALYLSKRFREVITLERDATLAAVAEENFRRLGATNIRVINSSAEAFQELLSQGPLTIEMEDYGGFEKVGGWGRRCPGTIPRLPHSLGT